MPATATDRLNGLTTSLAVKPPCRVATTANITLSGLQTIDGVTVVAGDRVLVKDQTTQSDNGIYEANTSAWSRAPDFDGARDAAKGTLVIVHSGTTNAGTTWELTTADTVTIGTSSLTFRRGLLSSSDTVGFLQAGTGAEERTVQDKLRETSVSVCDYDGVDPTGATDSTSGIQAALTYAMANSKALRFPAGLYKISSAITASGPFPISLLGDGEGVTRIDYTATAASIQLTNTWEDCGAPWVVQGIAFVTGINSVDLALKLSSTKKNGLRPAAFISNCFFGPDSFTDTVTANKYFDIALHLHAIPYSTVQACKFSGRAPGTPGVQRNIIGIYLTGDYTPGPRLISCDFVQLGYGVKKADEALQMEGLFVSLCQFVACDWGLWLDATAQNGSPGFWIADSHFNCEFGGIYAKDINQMTIHNNLFYGGNTPNNGYNDVYLEECSVVEVSNNLWASPPSGTGSIAVKMVNCNVVNVFNNQAATGCRATGLHIDANCLNIRWGNNAFDEFATPVNNSITNKARYTQKSIQAPAYAQSHTPDVQALANNTATNIIWKEANTTLAYTGGWAAANPTRFVVPAGVTLVRFHCQVGFDANVTGVRVVRQLKNGAPFAGNGHHRGNACSSGPTHFTCVSAIVEVVAGDYFEVELTQTSGGALNTVSSQQVSATLEIVG